jgi:hypothetical protein
MYGDAMARDWCRSLWGLNSTTDLNPHGVGGGT